MATCQNVFKRCSAPSNGVQCVHPVMNVRKLHCKQHFPKAFSLYQQYKQICLKLDNYDIKKIHLFSTHDKMTYLHEYYCLLIRAYKGREKHKTYAFVPTLFDKGHEEQFKILKRKIENVEKELANISQQITKQINTNSQNPINDFVKTDDNTNNFEIFIMKEVENFKKKRIADDKLLNMELKKYIQQNKNYEKKNNKNINYCLDSMVSLCKSQDYIKLAGLYCLVGTLYKINYFKPNFNPPQCDCGDTCDDFLAVRIKKSCSCSSCFSTMREFFSHKNENDIAILRQVLEKHRERIKHVCHSYNQLWKHYEYELFCNDTELFFLWNENLQELYLHVQFQEDNYETDYSDYDDEPKFIPTENRNSE